jgi:hypothetical protein
MAGFLDEYGVEDARRSRRYIRIALAVLAAAILIPSLYFTFRNWSEERRISSFVDLLKQKNYSAAYELWKTPDAAKFYPPQKFLEDFGEKGTYNNPSAMKILNVDACDAGVVFDVQYQADEFGLWVDRSNGAISFAPWNRCPGRHLHMMEFLRAQFGGEKK